MTPLYGMLVVSTDGDYWLASYDPDYANGRGRVEGTRDPVHAMRFESFGDAMSLWRLQSTVCPLRRDGKPNRPLSAYTVRIEQLP